jgi:hypothetical protein
MNFTLANFFWGLLAAGVGVLGVKYTFQVVGITGRQDWLERYTGQGTTYFMFKMFFLLIAIGGILFASGFGGGVMNFIFSPLRHIFQPVGQ